MSLRTTMNSAVRNIAVKLDTIAVPADYDPRTDKKAYMNPRMLAYFYNRLQADRKAITAELQEKRGLITAPIHTGDEADRAAAAMERAIAHAQIDTLYRKQEAISIHLIDMEQNGTQANYGYCGETGEKIGVERLYNTPHASLTKAAQETMEKRDRQLNASGGVLSSHMEREQLSPPPRTGMFTTSRHKNYG